MFRLASWKISRGDVDTVGKLIVLFIWIRFCNILVSGGTSKKRNELHWNILCVMADYHGFARWSGYSEKFATKRACDLFSLFGYFL